MLASLAVVYVFVLVGSSVGICVLLGVRVLLRNRSVRKFVRSVRQRVHSAEERGNVFVQETKIERPRKSPRTSAIELQEARSLLRMADKSFAQEKIEEAERHYIQALTILPDDVDTRAQLAKFYLQTGREQKAEVMYIELIAKHDDVSYFANLGLAYYKQKKYIESCWSYREALKRDAKNPERGAALGRACIAARRFREAVPLLEKSCMRLSRDTELLHLLAESYLQLGHREKAEETYKRINKLEPYNERVKEALKALAKV